MHPEEHPPWKNCQWITHRWHTLLHACTKQLCMWLCNLTKNISGCRLFYHNHVFCIGKKSIEQLCPTASRLSWVQDHLHQALQHQKQCYDHKTSGGRYKVGDSVWYSPALSRGQASKFHRPWKGPYQVVKVLSDLTYRIQIVSPNCRDRWCNYRLVVHFNQLKPCPPAKELSTFNTRVQYWDFQYWGYSTTGNHWMWNGVLGQLLAGIFHEFTTGPTVCVFRISIWTMVRKMSQSNLKLLKVDQCGDPDYVKQYAPDCYQPAVTSASQRRE